MSLPAVDRLVYSHLREARKFTEEKSHISQNLSFKEIMKSLYRPEIES